MTSYRCIVILLAFLFCLASAAPISTSIDGIDNTLHVPSTISNENKPSQQNSMIPSSWSQSTTERGFLHNFFQTYTILSSWQSKAEQASSNQHSSSLRRRIARRRHP